MYSIVNRIDESSLSLAILFLSDIHLGHRNVSTKDLIESCWDIISRSGDLDIIIVPGDLFDRSISLSSDCAIRSILFVTDLKIHCSKRGISLVIMNGTPSHDRGQGVILRSILGSDYEIENGLIIYIDDVRSVNIKGLDIVFVPDKMAETSYEVSMKVKNLSEGKVYHLLVMHCAFGFQLPDFVDAFEETDFLKYTETFVVAGHHHKPDEFLVDGDPRILIPGSVGLLKHGEEEDVKGALVVQINTVEKTACYKRIENLDPAVFKTIDVSNMSVVDFEILAGNILKGTNRDCSICIKGFPTSPVFIAAGSFRTKFPGISITRAILESNGEKVVSEPTHKEKLSKPDSLSRETLGSSLVKRIAGSGQGTDNIFDIINEVVI